MQEPYWAVFNEGRLTYLGLSQGEALEFLRINGGSSVEQIRSLDQLAEALHRHKADHEEKLAEAIVDILSTDFDLDKQLDECCQKINEFFGEVKINRAMIDAKLQELSAKGQVCREYGSKAMNLVKDWFKSISEPVQKKENEDAECTDCECRKD